MPWYNYKKYRNGGRVLHLNEGGRGWDVEVGPEAVSAAGVPAQFQSGYNPAAGWAPDTTVDPTSIDSGFTVGTPNFTPAAAPVANTPAGTNVDSYGGNSLYGASNTTPGVAGVANDIPNPADFNVVNDGYAVLGTDETYGNLADAVNAGQEAPLQGYIDTSDPNAPSGHTAAAVESYGLDPSILADESLFVDESDVGSGGFSAATDWLGNTWQGDPTLGYVNQDTGQVFTNLQDIGVAGTPNVNVPGSINYDNYGEAALSQVGQQISPEQAAAVNVSPTAGVPAIGGGIPNASPVGSYIQGSPGVNTGIPQGGHAANAIQSYLSGANADQYQQQVSDITGAPVAWGGVDHEALDAYSTNLAQQSDAAQASADSQSTFQGGFEGPGQQVQLPDGTQIAVDSQLEFDNAQQIAQNIEDGGINPETGDYNVVAGPNALSAADEGFFGIGSDYNQEFQENYEAQSDHADANPYGQTTGTPIYEQGYAEDGDIVAGILNNSTVGLLGNALTGEDLVPGYDALLPPAEAFTGGGGDDGPSAAEIAANNNDGDPTNDTGNAGWGFTSVTDLFDGGGPGSSGDSYSGGVHGDSTVGDTSEGVGSIVSSWFGGGSDDRGGSDDSGGDSGGSDDSGGTWCCTAAYKHGMPIRKIKELRKWHKSMPQFWQDGYDTYGNWIANNLVKGSPFWSRVTEAGHTAFVERRITPMSSLAVLVIAPGSIAVGLYKQLTRRKADAPTS